MSAPRKAIIIGAGPAGLSVALRLLQTTNIQPIVYELRPAPTTLGGAIGISANGLRLFDRLGVADALLARGSSRSDAAIYSLNAGKLGGLDDFAARARAQTGFGYMRIQRKDIVDVLLEAVQRAGIPVIFGRKLVEIQERDDSDTVRVRFEDGSIDEADMLIGCDGIHSAVRRMYIDQLTKPEYSGLSILFSIIPTSSVTSAVTSQLTGLNAILTAQGMFMAAPCKAAQDEIYWGFARHVEIPDPNGDRDGWELRGQQEVNGFRSMLHSVLAKGEGEWTEALKELVDATPVMKFYPIYRIPLGKRWSRGRCIVLGDAAHATQPHAGQGISLAVEDAFLLCRLLSNPARPTGEAYESFQRVRRPRVAEIHQTAASNAALREDATPAEEQKREDGIRAALSSEASALAAADRLLGQMYSRYDIDEEVI